MSSFSHKIYVWFCFASFPCDTSTDFSGKTHRTPNELTLSKSGNNSTQQTWGVFRSSGPLCLVVFRHIAHRNGEAISFRCFVFTSATQRLIKYGPKWTILSFLKRQICTQTRSDEVFQSITKCSYITACNSRASRQRDVVLQYHQGVIIKNICMLCYGLKA